MHESLDNEQDFKLLFDQHYAKLCSTAFSIIRNYEEAEDLVQNFFLKVWNNRTQIHIEYSFATYSHKAVYLMALNHNRQQARALRMVELESINSVIDPATESISTTEEEKEYLDILDEVERAISALPDKCQQIFRMAHHEKMKHMAIADQLGISVNTVKVQMSRAYREIRKKLKTKHIPYFIILFYPTFF